MEAASQPGCLGKHSYLERGFTTRALRAGEQLGQPSLPNHADTIVQTSTFALESAGPGAAIVAAKRDGLARPTLGFEDVDGLVGDLDAAPATV